MAYFTSEPSCLLANGPNQSDTDKLLQFTKAMEDISYHSKLWGFPLVSGATALISSLNVR
jgi:hypothetical protein